MVFEKGPYITLATFCENVIEDKSGVLSLIRIVDRFQVTKYGAEASEEMQPVQLVWFLVLSLKSGDARGSHELKIVPEKPSGIRAEAITLTPHLEGGIRGQNIVLKMDMKLEMPGIYWFKIYVNNVFMTQVPLEVIYNRVVTPPQVAH